MKDDNVSGSTYWPSLKARARRARFLVSVTAIVLLTVLAFEGIFLFWPSPADGNLVNFVCTSSSSHRAFVINARINLTDGMDQNEAMEVASKVLSEMPQQAAVQSLQLLSANSTCDEKGAWTVEFTFGGTVHERSIDRSQGAHDTSVMDGHSAALQCTLRSCVIVIDPSDQLVKYSG